MELYGNYTALITPFKTNKQIDFNSLNRLVDFQIQNKTNGIVALGSTAEASMLTNLEKHLIMQNIINQTNKKIPVIAGINAFSLIDAIEQSRARFIDGADALLVSPPPYIKPTDNGLINYFSKIADQSYIPIILYNIPSRTGVNISEQIVEKLSTHNNIIGIKEASGNIIYAQNIFLKTHNQNFSLITGNDSHIIPMLSLSSRAVISVIGNILPNLCCSFIDLYSNNKQNELYNLYNQFSPLINSLSLETNPVPIKYYMSKLNMIKEVYREPLCKMTLKNKYKINQIINTILK